MANHDIENPPLPPPPPAAAAAAAAPPQAEQPQVRLPADYSRFVLNLDMRSVAKFVEASMLFILFVTMIYIQHHIVGIVFYACFIIVVMKLEANFYDMFKESNTYSITKLGSMMFIGIVTPCTMSLIEPRLRDYLRLRASSEPLSFSDSLYIVLMCDVFVRAWTVAMCACIVLIGHGHNKKVFFPACNMLNNCSVCLRNIVVVPIWAQYISTIDTGQHLGGSGAASVYIFFKILKIYPVFRTTITGIFNVLRMTRGYGKRITREKALQDGDDQCCICMSPFQQPLQLKCNHIFCEACIESWLGSNTTCPMCRETIPNSGTDNNMIAQPSVRVAQLF